VDLSTETNNHHFSVHPAHHGWFLRIAGWKGIFGSYQQWAALHKAVQCLNFVLRTSFVIPSQAGF